MTTIHHNQTLILVRTKRGRAKQIYVLIQTSNTKTYTIMYKSKYKFVVIDTIILSIVLLTLDKQSS